MKATLLLPNDYVKIKQYLIEQINAWQIAIRDYEDKYNKNYFNKTTLLYAWHKAFERINSFLLSDRKIDCFIITDNNEELQGIAFGAKRYYGNATDALSLFGRQKIIPSYHIHDILTAPWNILARAFKETEENLQDRHKKIGTSLMKLIVTHAMTEDVKQIVADIDAPFDSGSFFSKCFFEQVTPVLGLTYQLSQKNFSEVVNKLEVNKEQSCSTKYSTFNVIDDYPIHTESLNL
ncbi:Uncharacterised protein [Legionella busanensis]|uniref:Uncharacterized protein n=1 Tax=Legionella busanensis TaxID=190655 RepID=A0A378KDI0_9GAMM|nr:hypothetical protein [Legionella busanensis]STX81685.1 Uncharacterised protein [Legionella busanensis]